MSLRSCFSGMAAALLLVLVLTAAEAKPKAKDCHDL